MKTGPILVESLKYARAISIHQNSRSKISEETVTTGMIKGCGVIWGGGGVGTLTMAQRVSAVSCLFREEEALPGYWEGLQHCWPLYPVIFVSPASNLQDSETFPCRMLLAKVCFLWHLDDFLISTMCTHIEGNRSSPKVISPEVMSLDTRVTSPAIYIYVARNFIKCYIHTLYTEKWPKWNEAGCVIYVVH